MDFANYFVLIVSTFRATMACNISQTYCGKMKTFNKYLNTKSCAATDLGLVVVQRRAGS
jgi:hypothetical protein